MRVDDAAALARLRIAAARNALLPSLGPGAAKKFFTLAARDPSTFGLVLVADNEVAGFAICTTAGSQLKRRVVATTPSLWRNGLRLLVRDPALFGQALRRLTGVIVPRPGRVSSGEPRLRLFDVAVADAKRGQGYGRTLVKAVLQESVRRGHSEIGLSVLLANQPAINLYGSLGFQESSRAVRADGEPFMTMHLQLAEEAIVQWP
jgi:ribosomal protein S18 acetylase RimI-like enzyme